MLVFLSAIFLNFFFCKKNVDCYKEVYRYMNEGKNSLSVSNYLNSSVITVSPTECGAKTAFNTPAKGVSLHIGESFGSRETRWIEVIRDMLLTARLTAVVEVSETTPLKEHLVNLTVAGVDEVRLCTRTKNLAKKYLQEACRINHEERLGLYIRV